MKIRDQTHFLDGFRLAITPGRLGIFIGKLRGGRLDNRAIR